MRTDTFTLTTDDGAQIFVRRWQPDGESRAPVTTRVVKLGR